MNDSGIFDDGQLSRESSVVRSEASKPETIPPFPGQKRRTTGRANNKKRRRYEIVHMDHSYSYVPDPQFEYLYGAQTEDTGDTRLNKATANPPLGEDTEPALEAQISSPGLGGVEGISGISGTTFSRKSSVEKVRRTKC